MHCYTYTVITLNVKTVCNSVLGNCTRNTYVVGLNMIFKEVESIPHPYVTLNSFELLETSKQTLPGKKGERKLLFPEK